MPKPVNKDRGYCPCRVKGCDELAAVRRMKDHDRGALYLVCPVHGVDRTSGKHQAALDEWIEQNRVESRPDPAPTPEPDPAPTPEPDPSPTPEPDPAPAAAGPEPATDPEPAPALEQPGPDPEPAPEPKPKRRGFLAGALDEFRGWME